MFLDMFSDPAFLAFLELELFKQSIKDIIKFLADEFGKVHGKQVEKFKTKGGAYRTKMEARYKKISSSKNISRILQHEGHVRTLENLGVVNMTDDEKALNIQRSEANLTEAQIKLDMLMENAADDPLGEIAAEAFGQFSGMLDNFNLGGFQNLTNMTVLNNMRDQYFTSMSEQFPSGRGIWGPLDYINDDKLNDMLADLAGQMHVYIVQNYLVSTFAKTYKPASLSDAMNPVLTAGQYEQFCTHYFTDDVLNQIAVDVYAQLCFGNNGIAMNDGTCSFKKNDCIPPWHDTVTPSSPYVHAPSPVVTPSSSTSLLPGINPGEAYFEWNKHHGFCELKPSKMRTKCESIGYGVTYDPDQDTCKLTEEYCGRYGTDGLNSKGDCEINKGQEFAEMLLGTTVVRGVNNFFNPNNWGPCPDGTTDLGLTCLNTNDCGPGRQKMGGICYDSCKPGYQSSWKINGASDGNIDGMCYQDCDTNKFDRATTLQCVRDYKSKIQKSTEAQCPAGTKERTPGFCQPDCPNGGYFQAGICYPHNVVRDDLGDVMPTVTAHMECSKPSSGGSVHFRGLDCVQCDWGDDWIAGTCWRNGITSWPGNIINTDRTCPDGYTQDAGGLLCQVTSSVAPVERPKTDIGSCPPGYHLPDGLDYCYENCESGYHESAVGICAKDYLAVERDSYVRKPGGVAYRVTGKPRTADFANTTREDLATSAAGEHLISAANAVANGDANGFGRAFAAYTLVTNPVITGAYMGPTVNTLAGCRIDPNAASCTNPSS
jgi:hypothetical protein